MNAALGFGGRNPLHPMGTGFKLQVGIDVITDNTADNFLVTSVLPFILTDNLNTPAPVFCITGIHAIQVTGKNGSLIPPGTGTYFQKYITAVERVPGQHQALQILLQLLTLFFIDGQLFFTHFFQIGITEPAFCLINIFQYLIILAVALYHRFYFSVFLGQLAKFILIRNHIRLAQQHAHFFIAFAAAGQFHSQRIFHVTISCSDGARLVQRVLKRKVKGQPS